MSLYKSELLRVMEAKGYTHYSDMDDYVVELRYSAKNLPDKISIKVMFDEDDEGLIEMCSWSCGHVPNGKRAAVLAACNTLNATKRWVTFFVDKDDDIGVSADAIVNMETVGDICDELADKMAGIIDGCYPELMKAIWG